MPGWRFTEQNIKYVTQLETRLGKTDRFNNKAIHFYINIYFRVPDLDIC